MGGLEVFTKGLNVWIVLPTLEQLLHGAIANSNILFELGPLFEPLQGNEEIKRRTRVVGIFSNAAAIIRLVGAALLEQHEHWQPGGRRMFSAESMATIADLDAIPALQATSA